MLLQLNAIGHLGRDAVLRQVNGTDVLNFTIAHTEKFKDAHGVTHERTTWLECALWRQTGVAPYLTKGTLVYISGTPAARAWQSNTGEARAALHVQVHNLRLLSTNRSAAPENTPTATPATAQPAAPPANAMEDVPAYDDLPF